MSIEQEIYNKLVEQFGIGEVCIKKYGKRPQKTWLEFISSNLQEETDKLQGFSSVSSLSRYFRSEFSKLMASKEKRPWQPWLLSLIGLKRCTRCTKPKTYENFSKDTYTYDSLKVTCKTCDKDYKIENREHNLDISRKYYQVNKEIFATKASIYRKNNLPLFASISAKYRATKLQATPNWADHEIIKQIYETCPKGYHVDHIVPLQNDLVCGLHCEFNLQHLTAAENLAKSNKFTC